MTRREALDRENFRLTLLGAVSGEYEKRQQAARAAELLCRHGKTYARLQEMNCNGVGTWYGESNESFSRRQDSFERKLERKEELLKKRIRAIVSELGDGFGVIFNGDPRGSTVKITVPSGQTNDWGKEGICVPTA